MADLILKNIFYAYPGTRNRILRDVNAVFPGGRVCSIRGQSGAGKSTLLYLVAGMDVPVSGEVVYNGRTLTKGMLDEYRRKEASTISQNYLLFPSWTVLENVCYPMELAKKEKRAAMAEAREHLKSVGIGEALHNRLPQKLSGGEQQRVAIARCLASHSGIIAADEPTGNLDGKNALAIMDMLLSLAHEQGKTVVMVTHDREIAGMADICYYLEDGILRKTAEKGLGSAESREDAGLSADLEKAVLQDENNMKDFVELCRELGASKEVTLQKLMEKKELGREAALQKIALYWKE